MKYILVALVATIAVVKAQETYGTQYDNVNGEAIVSDDQQFQSFVDCFMGAATCNEPAAAFKKVLPEAIVQACAKCNPAQKHLVRVFLEAYSKKMPQEYEKFKDLFDPERKYFPKFEASVAGF
ncbi:unnamed protein product [Spodoptera exigua]|uniref:Chemosensory protein 19 n=1 Tax=Spodoptera exigua TaxID=7107 RepID=A0A0K1DDT7_SPOEX|nr:chemosensory protein 19 [Spodoptera exigua]KAF9424876.1 hypothetical protein HW555_000177 [Spodoptera exigua]CAH0695913.1 unnamed protein product [Spodoptera exigua]